MSLLLIAPHDGTVRWQRGIMNNWPWPLHGTPASFKLSDTKTEVRSWTGSILFSILFFFVASLPVSHSFFSLLGNGQEKEKKTHGLTENLASTRMFIFLLSLSPALACQKGIQREAETKKKELGRTGQAFQSAFCCLPVGPGWSSVPAKFCFILLKWQEELI